jgi:hypothetical protein
MQCNPTCSELRISIMELYFKDLEAENGQTDLSLNFSGDEVGEERGETAEDKAFAELAERVSAARLVY